MQVISSYWAIGPSGFASTFGISARGLMGTLGWLGMGSLSEEGYWKEPYPTGEWDTL